MIKKFISCTFIGVAILIGVTGCGTGSFNMGDGDTLGSTIIDDNNNGNNNGTTNTVDLCPDNPNKTEPGNCGCDATDSDNDGIDDCEDECPNDPANDSDGDSFCADNDLCPDDANKTQPGICGCGVTDIDSDNDGIPDCNDQCPFNPNKSTASAECGCGDAESDSDGDGVEDCEDICLNDPDKTSPGVCGCGTPDTDNDNDGLIDCFDSCPNDPNNDADGDGACGDVDDCPDNPNVITAGECGCDATSTSSGSANIQFSVSFNDPGQANSGSYSEIERIIIASGNKWASRMITSQPVTIEVQVGFDSNPGSGVIAAARSFDTVFIERQNGIDVIEQGVAAEIRTGIDPNGASPDAEVIIYLLDELWFDPDPELRNTPVPGNKLDAMSVMMHELGHAIAYNGFHNGISSELPGVGSTYDTNITTDSEHFYFNGTNASNVYGSQVPLTDRSVHHVGNLAPGPGSDLDNQLMFASLVFGTRNSISDLDWSILKDTGLNISDSALQNSGGCSQSLQLQPRNHESFILGPKPPLQQCGREGCKGHHVK